jgi:hypothetical protein
MKSEIALNASDNHATITRKIGEWMEYYNSARPQWNLRKLTPNEYYEFTKSGIYPLAIPMPTEKVSPKKHLKQKLVQPNTEAESVSPSQVLGGSAPEPSEFNALSLQSDGTRTDGDCSPPVTP